jgi:hypothetical protein
MGRKWLGIAFVTFLVGYFLFGEGAAPDRRAAKAGVHRLLLRMASRTAEGLEHYTGASRASAAAAVRREAALGGMRHFTVATPPRRGAGDRPGTSDFFFTDAGHWVEIRSDGSDQVWEVAETNSRADSASAWYLLSRYPLGMESRWVPLPSPEEKAQSLYGRGAFESRWTPIGRIVWDSLQPAPWRADSVGHLDILAANHRGVYMSGSGPAALYTALFRAKGAHRRIRSMAVTQNGQWAVVAAPQAKGAGTQRSSAEQADDLPSWWSDAKTRQKVQDILDPRREPEQVVFTPAGEVVVGYANARIALGDSVVGAEADPALVAAVRRMKAEGASIRAVAIGAAGSFVVVSGEGVPHWRNIPRDMEATFARLADAGRAVESVALSTGSVPDSAIWAIVAEPDRDPFAP